MIERRIDEMNDHQSLKFATILDLGSLYKGKILMELPTGGTVMPAIIWKAIVTVGYNHPFSWV